MDDDGIGDTSNEVQDELRYCYCNGPSYGEMVACDRKKCEREWYVHPLYLTDCRFHLECAGLAAPPKGEWFCKDCKKIMERERRSGGTNKKARLEGGKTSR
jgi:inhibitor of growth protein 3